MLFTCVCKKTQNTLVVSTNVCIKFMKVIITLNTYCACQLTYIIYSVNTKLIGAF